MSIELARKRAKKFFQYHKLSLPVKIDELLKHYADVKEAYIPVDGDAICLNNDKPLIIIKSNMSPLRKRFTYAHELAHLQIPSQNWQMRDFPLTQLNHVLQLVLQPT